MKNALLTRLAPLAFTAVLLLTQPAHASVLASQTQPVAGAVEMYGTFHDAVSDFVFVKLPTGWAFVAEDHASSSHEVFLDPSSGFVFVKLSGGWKFVRAIA